MLSRLEVMVLMAGMDLPLTAIHPRANRLRRGHHRPDHPLFLRLAQGGEYLRGNRHRDGTIQLQDTSRTAGSGTYGTRCRN